MGMGGARPGAGRKPKADARRAATFTLPPDQLAAIEALAGRDGISRSEALSRLIALALAAEVEPVTAAPVTDDVAPVEAAASPAPFPVVVGDVLRDTSKRPTRLLRVTEIGKRGITAVATDSNRKRPAERMWSEGRLIALLAGGQLTIQR